LIGIAVGVIAVFVLGAVYVLRQSTGGGSRPVGAFRRSRTDGGGAPILILGGESGSGDDDRAESDSDTFDSGSDSSDAGGSAGDAGGGDGGGGGGSE
jgi:hypothetical protein